MNESARWPLDGGGTNGPDGGRRDADPLARACAQLNFAHSLVADASRLRSRMLDSFLDLAETFEQLSRTWDQCADRGTGRSPDRYRARATQARVRVTTARHRAEDAASLQIGDPRPEA
jgi:hypothetical protein